MKASRTTLIQRAQTSIGEGRSDEIVDLWEQYQRFDNSDESELEQWAFLLLEAGEREKSLKVLELIHSAEFKTAFRDVLDETEELLQEEPDDIDEIFQSDEPQKDDQIVQLFLKWFGGRRDLWARQWFDQKRRRSGYKLVRAPLTEQIVRQHLDGRITLGQYLLFPDGTCSYGVIDLDLSSRAMEEHEASFGSTVSVLKNDSLRQYILAVDNAAKQLGISFFTEESGSRGVHLWCFVEPRRPARALRMLLGQIVSAAGPQPPDVNVEIFPKQDSLGPKGLSSLVKLPLGIHQVTLRRCFLLTKNFEPITDPFEALSQLRITPPEVISQIVGHQTMASPLPVANSSDTLPKLSPVESARSLAEALHAIPQGKEEQEACDRMISGCVILRKIVERAFAKHKLEPAEIRALIYTIGLVGQECQLIEDVFNTINASRKELERVRRGIPSPTGCRKLRRLLTAPTTACPCEVSEERVQPYATPAIFAVGSIAPSPPRWKPFSQWLEAAPPTGADPFEIVAERLLRIDERLAKIESEK